MELSLQEVDDRFPGFATDLSNDGVGVDARDIFRDRMNSAAGKQQQS
jgi:hypothetical protein